jgi:hypothetical protein
MERRVRWVEERQLVSIGPPTHNQHVSQQQIRDHPEEHTGMRVWGRQEIMLSVNGRKRLNKQPILTCLRTTRNTDDFMLSVKDEYTALTTAKVVQWMHRRWQFPLKVSKFGVGQRVKYDGVWFDARTLTLEIPAEKIMKALKITEAALPGKKVSVKEVESIAGLVLWMSKVFPYIRPWLRSFFAWIAKHAAIVKSKPGLSEESRLAGLGREAARDLLFLRALLASGIRSRSVFLRATVAGPAAIEAVIHLDWAMTPVHCCAGVELRSGEWFQHRLSERITARLCERGTPNTPALEGCSLPIALFTFADLVRGKVVLVCMDSLVFLQAAANMQSTSAPLAELIKVVAFAQILLHCHILGDFVDTHSNLADPLSRMQTEVFRTRCGEKGLSPRLSPRKSRLPPARGCPSGSSVF